MSPTLTPSLQEQFSGHPFLHQTRIVNQPGDLPETAQREILRNGLAPEAVRGLYADGQCYLVSSNLEDVATGIKVALHEAVGHYGIRALLGDRLEPVMLEIFNSFPRDHSTWKTTEERYAFLDTGTQAGKVAFAEELTAHMAETDAELSEWDMVQAEIRQAIRQQFPALPMTELDVKAMVQRSRESLILRHGDPGDASAIRDKLARRQRVTDSVIESQARNGRWAPDAMSLALWRDGGQVVNDDGVPSRLYHGSGGEVGDIRRGFWGVTDPDLANQYAKMRSDQGAPAQVIPYYANIKRPFDGDALKNVSASRSYPDGLSIGAFIDELIKQGDVTTQREETLHALGRSLVRAARREESGPTYEPNNFWYLPHWYFGIEGERLLANAFEIAGFDGVRFTEQGHLSYGAFSAAQLHFLDQGATPRGWQPDRHHGEGPMTERPAFREWFGDSQVIDPEGSPLVMYHGTTGDITAFAESKIRPIDLDASCNGYWFSSSKSTSPAMKDPSNVMPVYLAIENPAPYPLVEKVYRQVSRDRKQRAAARSEHDEVRYRLQEMGYDGFFFNEPVSLSSQQRETYARTGQVVLTDTRGQELVLRHREMAVRDWQEVPYQAEGVAYTNKNGQRVTLNAAHLDSGSLVRNLGYDELVSFDDVDVMLETLQQVSDFLAQKEGVLEVGQTRLEHTTIDSTYPELAPTGEVVNVVDLYNEYVGHVTGYESLEDFEAMHGELVAVAFKPEQIKSAIGNRGTFLRNHPDIRFSFLGEAAKTANRHTLDYAKRSLLAGLSSEAVRQRTGWHRGKDNRWRFEIDDSQAELKPALKSLQKGGNRSKAIDSLEYRRHADGTYSLTMHPRDAKATGDFIELVEVQRSVVNAMVPADVMQAIDAGEGVDEWGELFPEMGLTLRRDFDVAPMNALPLDQVLDHPALFAAYPQLSDVMVRVDPSLGGKASFGKASDGSSVVHLGRAYQLSNLMHELQHAIQFVEHFAMGGSPESRKQEAERAASATFTEAEIAFRAAGDNLPSLRDAYLRLSGIRLTLCHELGIDARDADASRQLRDAITPEQNGRYRAVTQAYYDAIEAAGGFDSPAVRALIDSGQALQRAYAATKVSDYAVFTDYMRLAGEVEARNVQARLLLSPAERQRLAPSDTQDTPDDDLLVVFNGEVMDNAPPPANIRAPKIREAPGRGAQAFLRWFADSQVVDSQGKPLVMYHGTNKAFDSFAKDLGGGSKGWFTSSPRLASTFGDSQNGGNVMPVYLSIQNPVDPDVALEKAREAGVPLIERREWLQTHWDGYRIEQSGATTYIPFWPEQIKSVFNVGNFDPAEEDIRLSVAGGTARTADRLTHDYARRALAAGMTPDLVRELTGWDKAAHQHTPPSQTEDVPREQQIRTSDGDRLITPSHPVSLAVVDATAGQVTNQTGAGRQLQDVADQLLGVLDVSGYEVGWMDGGCRIFAEALQTWSRDRIRLGATGRGQDVSHVVGILPLNEQSDSPCVLLDADGVNTPQGMLEKLAQIEKSPGEKMIAIEARADSLAAGIAADPPLSRRLGQLMEMRLGPFENWQSALSAELEDLGMTIEPTQNPTGSRHHDPSRGDMSPRGL